MCQSRFHPHKQSVLVWFPRSLSDRLLPFLGLVPGNVPSFFTGYAQSVKCLAYGSFTAVKFLCDLFRVCVWMCLHIRFQLFRFDLFITTNYGSWSQCSFLFPLPFPCAYGADWYLEYFMGFFQRVSFSSIFYCPFPVILWITHALILIHSTFVFKCVNYNRLTDEEKQWLVRIARKSELMKGHISQRGKKYKQQDGCVQF